MSDTSYAQPGNHEAMFALASRMHDVLSEAALAGYGPGDLASAVAMLNGLFIAAPYDTEHKRRWAMEVITRAALKHAERARLIFRTVDLSRSGSA